MNHHKRILICVTQQKTCERLIRKAASIQENKGGELFVIHVAKNEWNFLNNEKEGEALEYLFSISKSIGASLAVLKSDDIVGTIANFVRENQIDFVILGESSNDYNDSKFLDELKASLVHVEIQIVPKNEFL